MTEEQMNEWAKDLCEKLKLPVCRTTVHINLDGDLLPTGQDGCVLTYEAAGPEAGRYCISINKNIMNDKNAVFNALYRQVLCYKSLLEKDGE